MLEDDEEIPVAFLVSRKRESWSEVKERLAKRKRRMAERGNADALTEVDQVRQQEQAPMEPSSITRFKWRR